MVLVALASACGGSQPPTALSGPMSPEEAQRTLRTYAEAQGIPPLAPTTPPPSSLADVVEVVREERLQDYDAARGIMAGIQGPEALTLRSLLELSQANAYLTAAAILREIKERKVAEAQVAAADQAEELAREAREIDRVIQALRTLAEEPLAAGRRLYQEALRQAPDDPGGSLAEAEFHRLRGQWRDFDMAIRRVEGAEPYALQVRYLRAMESSERFANAARAAERLEAIVAERPGAIRARASLVFVQDDIEATHRKLNELRALRPEHFVVRLAAPLIDAQYRATEELRQVRGP